MPNNIEKKGNVLISVNDIYKSFGTNNVLKGITLSVDKGEVLALIGGNGAGKSTLMKIIVGLHSYDKGEMLINGEKVVFSKASQALAKGIYMVPQEPLLFPHMSVEENILIGFSENEQELKNRLHKKMQEIGWSIDLTRSASGLSIAEQQMVEFMRGLMREAKLLILDEPTSSLTFDEVETLFKSLKDLKEKGIGIIYITHRLPEVFEISTHVAIMRDGIITIKGETKDFTKEDLVKGLLPANTNLEKEIKKEYKNIDYTQNPILELLDFSGFGFNDINLKVYPGEILGVSGVVGAGRTEMITSIFGIEKVLKGKVVLEGKDITSYKTKRVIEEGINLVSEDRHLYGLFKLADVADNTISALLNSKRMGKVLLNKKEEESITQKYVDDFRTKITSQGQLTGSLSGGNQQKVVIARSLTTNPKVVIFDEPTRGIDAAARADVYKIIMGLKEQGVSVLLISSDMEEIVELADRVVTMYHGKLVAHFNKNEITQEALMSAAFGVKAEKEEKQYA